MRKKHFYERKMKGKKKRENRKDKGRIVTSSVVGSGGAGRRSRSIYAGKCSRCGLFGGYRTSTVPCVFLHLFLFI